MNPDVKKQMSDYPVNKLAKLAGVSVRTPHHYDNIGLLRPSIRTEAGYRLYGEKELLRLQQILFYKELDFPLEQIRQILDDQDFNLIQALKNHKRAIAERRKRLSTLLGTIDKTILKIKGEQIMITNEELYAGFPKDKAEAYRQEAIEKYGKAAVEESEAKLKAMGKPDFEKLKADGEDITKQIGLLMEMDPSAPEVQAQIARHFANIQMFWGDSVAKDNRLEAYGGLAKLYIEDGRFYADRDPAFANFFSKAMLHFVAEKKKDQ